MCFLTGKQVEMIFSILRYVRETVLLGTVISLHLSETKCFSAVLDVIFVLQQENGSVGNLFFCFIHD